LNIFVTDTCPALSALALDDRRLNSQIRESVQLLSNALGNPEGCYRPTHLQHPCSLWVARSVENFWWLFDHCTSLGVVWHNRVSVDTLPELPDLHASLKVLFGPVFSSAPQRPETRPIEFQNSARNASLGVDFTDRPTVIQSYRDYLSYRWSETDRNPTWKRGVQPKWYKQ
jgi:hypothetical protein